MAHQESRETGINSDSKSSKGRDSPRRSYDLEGDRRTREQILDDTPRAACDGQDWAIHEETDWPIHLPCRPQRLGGEK
jgi:hypothetical protein